MGDNEQNVEMVAVDDSIMDTDQNTPLTMITHCPKSSISQRQFMRFRMQLRTANKNAFHWLWFARRLAEHFVITVLNRVERDEMDQQRQLQEKKNYRQIIARDFLDAIEKGIHKLGPNAKLGKVFMMSKKFVGSRQFYQEKYADLMTMVQRIGNPTWLVYLIFLIFTFFHFFKSGLLRLLATRNGPKLRKH